MLYLATSREDELSDLRVRRAKKKKKRQRPECQRIRCSAFQDTRDGAAARIDARQIRERWRSRISHRTLISFVPLSFSDVLYTSFQMARHGMAWHGPPAKVKAVWRLVMSIYWRAHVPLRLRRWSRRRRGRWWWYTIRYELRLSASVRIMQNQRNFTGLYSIILGYNMPMVLKN